MPDKKIDPAEIVAKLESGEITLDDLPPEAAAYATSQMPDLDDDFFKVYRSKFQIGSDVIPYPCPFCEGHEWKVIPFFGSLMSLRSYGPKGIHANKEVYALIECESCKYTMMFNMRESIERIVKEAQKLDVQMQAMRDEHDPESTDAEEDPPSGDGGPENR